MKTTAFCTTFTLELRDVVLIVNIQHNGKTREVCRKLPFGTDEIAFELH